MKLGKIFTKIYDFHHYGHVEQHIKAIIAAGGWCWFVVRENYCWLAGGWCWFGVREKYCWLAGEVVSKTECNFNLCMEQNLLHDPA